MNKQVRSLLSPNAERLLMVLTPEPMPCSEREAESQAVCELQRLGLAEVKWIGPEWALWLTKAGAVMRPSMRN